MTQAMIGDWVYKNVSVITNDGRHIVGTMRAFDNNLNLVLTNSHERMYSISNSVELIPLGLYVIRGDNIVVLGPLDEATDRELDLENTRCAPLVSIVH